MRKYLIGLLAGMTLAVVVLPVERRIEVAGGRQVNLLLADGFMLYDPEGFRVDHFNESFER
jgi:hypothetical protein